MVKAELGPGSATATANVMQTKVNESIPSAHPQSLLINEKINTTRRTGQKTTSAFVLGLSQLTLIICGARSAIILPSLMVIMRFVRSANALSWVTIIMVRPSE